MEQRLKRLRRKKISYAIVTRKNYFIGFNDFKLNFGADVFEYFGDFEVVTNPTLYFMYNRERLRIAHAGCRFLV